MTQRFVTEFLIASIAAAVSVAAISAYVTPEWTIGSFFWRAMAMIVVVALAQWLVLRRYVPWAQWWAHATVFGDFATSALVSLLMNMTVIPGVRTDRTQVVVMLIFGLGGALAQLPILYGRVKDAWLWLVACGASQPLAYVLLQVVFPAGPGSETPTNATIAYSAAFSALTVTAQAAALTWLMREELEGAPPRRLGHTSLEFLIAWCVVPITVYKIAQALQFSTGGSALRFPMLVLLLGAGYVWVLSGVAGMATIKRRLIWAMAAAIVWTVGYSAQYNAYNGPVIFGLIAGLIPGVVLVSQNRSTQPAVAVEPSLH